MGIVIGLLLLFGYAMISNGIHALQISRTTENTITSKIRSLAVGLVEVQGKVIPVDPALLLRSPQTQTPCVYFKNYVRGGIFPWYVMIEGDRVINSYSNYEMKGIPFYIEDDTGKILIDPFLADINLNSKEYDTEKEHIVLRPGSTVYVSGVAIPNPDAPSDAVGNERLMIKKGHYDDPFSISENSKLAGRSSFMGLPFILAGLTLIFAAIIIGFQLYSIQF